MVKYFMKIDFVMPELEFAQDELWKSFLSLMSAKHIRFIIIITLASIILLPELHLVLQSIGKLLE